MSVSVTANQTVFGTPDSYLATALLFRGDAIKSSNKDEGGKTGRAAPEKKNGAREEEEEED